jgi:glycosyltransferase involved in cell wall biosynthesis
MAELTDPQFEQQREIAIGRYKQTLNDSSSLAISKSHVLLLSYNRPRMLKDAVDSVKKQNDQTLILHIIDDGSDFSSDYFYNEILKEHDFDVVYYQHPKMDNTERVKNNRLSDNINAVIETLSKEDIVNYLCDDDILGVNWVSRAAKALDSTPKMHVAVGQAFTFNDNQDPYTESIFGMPGDFSDKALYWGTGTFAHKVLCFKDEDIRWQSNNFGHSQDIRFINDMMNMHPQFLVLESPVVYRREHEKSLSSLLGRKDKYGRYKPGYIPPPISEEILGVMESCA